MFTRPDKINDTLYVITAVFNPKRYRSRWKILEETQKHFIAGGCHLITIEACFGDRCRVITEQLSDKHTIIHVHAKHELWLKENLYNIAVQHLTILFPGWKYVAMIDGDMTFGRSDWVGETLQLLQHYPIVQLFSQVTNLSPDKEIISTSLSFMEGWRQGIPFKNHHGHVKHHGIHCYGDHNTNIKIGWAGAPGGAWAYTREALDLLGGLIDYAILGSADYHMAAALMGFLHISMGSGGTSNSKDYHPDYVKMLLDWQENAVKKIKRNVGVMKGVMFHSWHGKMKDRAYDTRWKILIKHQYNPRTDIYRNTSGVIHLNDEKWQLRDDARHYFGQRNEDSIDL
jgi:hypothetical protein